MTGRPPGPDLLRLQHLQPKPWQRAAIDAGPALVAVLLVMADLATAWTLLVLPVAAAAVVKSHDVAAGLLLRRTPECSAAPSAGVSRSAPGGG